MLWVQHINNAYLFYSDTGHSNEMVESKYSDPSNKWAVISDMALHSHLYLYIGNLDCFECGNAVFQLDGAHLKYRIYSYVHAYLFKCPVLVCKMLLKPGVGGNIDIKKML